jgi:hypothetical protein
MDNIVVDTNPLVYIYNADLILERIMLYYLVTCRKKYLVIPKIVL